MARKLIFFLVFIGMVFSLQEAVLAVNYTSDNFKIVDPMVNYGGVVNSSSDNFKLIAELSESAVGSSSNGTFNLNSGSLFFSVGASTPTAGPAVSPANGNYSSYLDSLNKLGIFPLLPTEAKPCSIIFDLNCDGIVSLKDFSIFLAVQNRPASNNPADFNKDNKVDVKDLSILLSEWTGKLLSFLEPVPGAFLTGPVKKLSFSGEASISVLKKPSKLPLSTSFSRKPIVVVESGFVGAAVRFFSGVFDIIIKLFTR